MEKLIIERSMDEIRQYIEERNYSGYDPYDGLKITSSRLILKNRFTNAVVTQLFKRIPINIRPVLGISKTRMPKTVGICLQAYSLLAGIRRFQESRNEYLNRATCAIDWLRRHQAQGYSGSCWGFGFHYKHMGEIPTVVITSIIAKGIYSYYLQTKDPGAHEMLCRAADFILNDLYVYEAMDGICFSYTPEKQDLCFNANMLAAETLAAVYSVSGKGELLPYIEKAADFTVAHQKMDGRWNYSIDMKSGKEREQVDFHQGYILESLLRVMELSKIQKESYRRALLNGADFYRQRQFLPSGKSLWRYPRKFPTDIHNQSQGIITFSILNRTIPDSLRIAETIAAWTINNMQDSEGYFYFRKGRFLTNRVHYMRWSQAWMFLALATMLQAQTR